MEGLFIGWKVQFDPPVIKLSIRKVLVTVATIFN